MTNDPWDEVAKEADLLALAIATGTLEARHVELGPDSPATADTREQRAERRRRAGARAQSRRRRSITYRASDAALGVASPYPDVHETYCTGDIWEREPTEAQLRDAANDLVGMGWPVEVVARLLRVPPKPRP